MWEELAAAYQASLARDPTLSLDKKKMLFKSLLLLSTEDNPFTVVVPDSETDESDTH